MGAFNPLKSNAHILAYVVLELGRVGNSEEMCREMPDSQSVKIAGGRGDEEGSRPIPHLITQKWKL